MFGHKLRTLALAAGALAMIGAGEPVKIEVKGWISNPVFSADGKILAFVRMEQPPRDADMRKTPTQIVLWDVKAGRELRRIKGPDDDSFQSHLDPVALAPDGKRLAIGLWNTSIRLWDLEAGKEIGRVENSQGARHLRFAPDGRTIGWLKGGEIHLSDATSGKELRRFGKEAKDGVADFAFVDGGKTMLITHRESTRLPGGGKMPSFEYRFTYWACEAASGKKLRQIGTTDKGVGSGGDYIPPMHSLFVAPESKSVVIAGPSGNIQVCDWTTGKKVRDIAVPWKLAAGEGIGRLAFSASGQIVAFGPHAAKRGITVWDLAAGKELRRIETPQQVGQIVLSPDGKTVAVISQRADGQVGLVLLIYGP